MEGGQDSGPALPGLRGHRQCPSVFFLLWATGCVDSTGNARASTSAYSFCAFNPCPNTHPIIQTSTPALVSQALVVGPPELRPLCPQQLLHLLCKTWVSMARLVPSC